MLSAIKQAKSYLHSPSNGGIKLLFSCHLFCTVARWSFWQKMYCNRLLGWRRKGYNECLPCSWESSNRGSRKESGVVKTDICGWMISIYTLEQTSNNKEVWIELNWVRVRKCDRCNNDSWWRHTVAYSILASGLDVQAVIQECRYAPDLLAPDKSTSPSD